MKMIVKTYASFEVLLELDTVDADEAEREDERRSKTWRSEAPGERSLPSCRLPDPSLSSHPISLPVTE